MTDTTHKEWPKAIRREPVLTVYPTSHETALNQGNLVFCVNIGRPKQNDIPSHLKNYFEKLGYKNEHRERGIPIMIHNDEEAYIQSLVTARHHLANERNYHQRIHAITVVPVDCLNDFILLKNNADFLRLNGIHGISLLDQGETFNTIPIRLGIVDKKTLGLVL